MDDDTKQAQRAELRRLVEAYRDALDGKFSELDGLRIARSELCDALFADGADALAALLDDAERPEALRDAAENAISARYGSETGMTVTLCTCCVLAGGRLDPAPMCPFHGAA